MSTLDDIKKALGVKKFTHMYCGINCTEKEYLFLCNSLSHRPMASKEEVSQVLELHRATSAKPKILVGEPGETVILPLLINDNPKAEIYMHTPEPEVSSSVEATLAQRGSRYGDFTDHARVCQNLKNTMTSASSENGLQLGWEKLSDVQKQALEVIADKIARILTGDPNYDDNWHDIQGYAKLVEDRLPCNQVKEASNASS